MEIDVEFRPGINEMLTRIGKMPVRFGLLSSPLCTCKHPIESGTKGSKIYKGR